MRTPPNNHLNPVDPALVRRYRTTRLTVREWFVWQLTRPRTLLIYGVVLLVLVLAF